MPKRTIDLLQRLLVGVAFVGFACRALIPVGYMPAPLADGGPFILCHGGAVGVDAEHANHAAHGAHAIESGAAASEHGSAPEPPPHVEHGDGLHEAWEHCPVGATAATAALAPTFDLPLLALTFTRPIAADAPEAPRAPLAHYRSRAPPFA